MTQDKNTLPLQQAKTMITQHVKAWILPYEPIDSEEFHDYLCLAPILAKNPEADLDELCASIIV